MTMENKVPLVAVIIVNYNGYELTRDCLLSFAGIKSDRYVLIVVDNASHDNSYQKLSAEFPEAHHVQSKINLGFTGGNNLGLEAAYALGVEYVFFLNNDTLVSENIFDLVTYLDTNPDVGMVAPMTYYHEDPEIISFGGGHLDRNTGRITFLNKGIKLCEMPANSVDCSFLEGAAIMARADLVKRAGGFNDDYFLCSEEAELCVKVADMGYRLVVVSGCSVWHKVSQTMGSGSELINYFVYRNRLYFIRNNALRFGLSEMSLILYNYLASYLSLMLKLRNFPAARGLMTGIVDFMRGVKGAGRFRQKLQLDNNTCFELRANP
jgi:GT2 family glycosyltransferase